MAYQEGVAIRNAQLSAKATAVGGSGTLKIFSGAEPANCAAGDPSGLLCTITLPASPFAAPSAGSMAKAGSWTASASGTGTAASFRVYDGSAVCHIQGAIPADMTLDNTSIASGQAVTVNTFTITAGNA
jgi:hypothetical protein